MARHARSTMRLAETQRTIGLALGGEPGARLAEKLGMPTSSATLLRRVKQTRPRAEPAPRVIGVDDWAIRKGQRYGTIIVDLERREVLELLPGRDGSELRTWLGQHPEIEILCRDRWTPYVEAATAAAPQARQIADRWHLLKNVRKALERFLDRHSGKIETAFTQTDPNPIDSVSDPNTPAEIVPPTTAKQQQRHARWQEVRRRREDGQSLRRIAREMQLSWQTVQCYARSDHLPTRRPGRQKPFQMTQYQERIEAWLSEGNSNAAALHRQLLSEGVRSGITTLRTYVSRLMAARGLSRPRSNAAQPPRPRAPSAAKLSFAVVTEPAQRTSTQQTRVARLRELSPEVAEALELVETFACLIRKDNGTTWQRWQLKVWESGCPELKRFADGLERDRAAVQAAFDESWSSGPVEGHINRLKTIKRQMYGRAALELLRARLVRAA